VPKQFFWATPGRVVREEKAKEYLEKMQNIKEVYLGQGVHYLQEDHPHQISEEIAMWVDNVDFSL
jgi:haloalkane dehalogenase